MLASPEDDDEESGGRAERSKNERKPRRKDASNSA